MSARPKKRRALRRHLRSVPFLPSLLTLGNAFCGFLAIVKITDAARLAGTGQLDAATWQLVEVAGLLLFLAMAFDGLDGKVARLTKQTTEFGAQLDSLADVVTFGVAPAVIAKFLITVHQAGKGVAPLAHQYLPFHPKIYYVCAAIYVLFAVMRLARFNVEVQDPDEKAHQEFQGLPSPAAATLVASLVVWLCAKDEKNSLTGLFFDETIYRTVIVALPGVLLLAGLLMVSRLPYPHVLNRVLTGRKSFPFLVLAASSLLLAVLEWQIVLVTASLLYVAMGPLIGAYRLVTGSPGPVLVIGDDEDDPEFDELEVEEPEEPRDEPGDEEPPVVRGPGSRRTS